MTAHLVSVKPAAAWQLALVDDLKAGRESGIRDVVDFSGRKLGRVEPLRYRHRDDSELIDLFVRWRNQHRSGWLDQRPVTSDGTRQWLASVLDDPLRMNMLFYIDDRIAGRGGARDLNRYGYETDGLVRGGRGGGLWFMHFVNFACMSWDFEHLDLGYMESKVLADNELALEATRVVGYQVVSSSVVVRKTDAEGVRWIEEASSAGLAAAVPVGRSDHTATAVLPSLDHKRLLRLRLTRCDFLAAREKAWRRQSFEGH